MSDKDKENKLQEYQDIGMQKFILDLVGQNPYQRYKELKKALHTLTPVESVYPPMINPPYNFMDDIKGEMICFPKDGKWDRKQESRFKAIEELSEYTKEYNSKVQITWKEEGVTDFDAENIHRLTPKQYPIRINFYDFICITSVGQYDLERKRKTRGQGMSSLGHRSVTNEKFWMFDFVWGWQTEEFVRLINASIYEYITLLVGDRTLEKDDVFYYPIKEFLYYADINGFRYKDEQTILTATSSVKLDDFWTWYENNDMVLNKGELKKIKHAKDLVIVLDEAQKKIKFSSSSAVQTEYIAISEEGILDSWFELLVRYAKLNQMLDDIPIDEVYKTWKKVVCGNISPASVVRYQNFINQYLRNNFPMIDTIFTRVNADASPVGMDTPDDFYYVCNLTIYTLDETNRIYVERGWDKKDAMDNLDADKEIQYLNRDEDILDID
tara:strand:+ start:95 stop:1414 length:1320 start_codon:yes stop_codon:yes gene_type:complete